MATLVRTCLSPFPEDLREVQPFSRIPRRAWGLLMGLLQGVGAHQTLATLAFSITRTGENIMSNASKRGEGAAEELGGKIKAGVGKLIGNEQMEAEGRAKELKGKGTQEVAKAGERVKGAAEEAVGAVKSRVGAVIDNEQMEAEGRATELKGEGRQELNR